MTDAAQFLVRWVDAGREPECPANPAYPDGIDVVALAPEGAATCTISLPYPARRCGFYSVVCRLCGVTVAVTTAGRADDPRSLTMPCRLAGRA